MDSIYSNDEPVEYCRNCLGLHIIEFNNEPLCMDCGATNFTHSTDIFKYEELVKEAAKKIHEGGQ